MVKVKDDCFYVVVLNGRKIVVRASVKGKETTFYECGDDQGWVKNRDSFTIKVVRQIRM